MNIPPPIHQYQNRSKKLPAEKINLSTGRFSLGVHNKTPIAAIRGELGLYPLSIYITDQMVKFNKRLMEQDGNSILGEAYAVSKDNALGNSWTNYFMRLCDKSNSNETGDNMTMEMQTDFENKWSKVLQRSENNKLRTYALVKKNFAFENYLDDVKINKHRVAFTRIRTSSHFLRIETGRYARSSKSLSRQPAPAISTPKSDNIAENKSRLCKHCTEEPVVEDERHFLISCPYYKNIRNDK